MTSMLGERYQRILFLFIFPVFLISTWIPTGRVSTGSEGERASSLHLGPTDLKTIPKALVSTHTISPLIWFGELARGKAMDICSPGMKKSRHPMEAPTRLTFLT